MYKTNILYQNKIFICSLDLFLYKSHIFYLIDDIKISHQLSMFTVNKFKDKIDILNKWN